MIKLLSLFPALLLLFVNTHRIEPAPMAEACPPPPLLIGVTNATSFWGCTYEVRGNIQATNGVTTVQVNSSAYTLADGASANVSFNIPAGYTYVPNSERFRIRSSVCGWSYWGTYVTGSQVFPGNCSDCDGPNHVTIWSNTGISSGIRTYQIQADLIV